MKRIGIATGIFLMSFVLSTASEKFLFREDKDQGTLTVFEGREKVLTYRFNDQLKEGVHPKQTRSCYIHPLYSLDGQVLTDDFIEDHLHHHGIFWTWPVVRTRGQTTQTWHPANLRQFFVRWLKRETDRHSVVLGVENVWKLDGKITVAEEQVTLQIHPAINNSRVIDVELLIQAVGGPLELQGTPEGGKGYGGLSFRGAPMFTGQAVTSDKGPLKEDINNTRFLWVDISTEDLGVAIFVAPDHPDFPIPWITRNSYAGFLNPSWPGLEAVVLTPGKPISLRYRIYIHQGDATSGGVKEAYKEYIDSYKKRQSHPSQLKQ